MGSRYGRSHLHHRERRAVKFRDNCTGEIQTTVRQGAIGSEDHRFFDASFPLG